MSSRCATPFLQLPKAASTCLAPKRFACACMRGFNRLLNLRCLNTCTIAAAGVTLRTSTSTVYVCCGGIVLSMREIVGFLWRCHTGAHTVRYPLDTSLNNPKYHQTTQLRRSAVACPISQHACISRDPATRGKLPPTTTTSGWYLQVAIFLQDASTEDLLAQMIAAKFAECLQRREVAVAAKQPPPQPLVMRCACLNCPDLQEYGYCKAICTDKGTLVCLLLLFVLSGGLVVKNLYVGWVRLLSWSSVAWCVPCVILHSFTTSMRVLSAYRRPANNCSSWIQLSVVGGVFVGHPCFDTSSATMICGPRLGLCLFSSFPGVKGL